MAEKSGFFNALRTQSGQYDIKYSAEDYSDNLAAIISDGVRRSGDDDLRVTAAGGFSLKVAPGRAWIHGRYYWNDAEYTSFSVPTPPVGDRSRIDRIALRLDTAINSRSIRLVYLQGEPAAEPQAPALTRSGSVYEMAIADISVPAAAGSISEANITDRRADKDLCGWITTPVGYSDYFTSLDAAFESWFQQVRDRVASVTMPRFYTQRIVTEGETSAVTFSIPQYDPTGVDKVLVAINGLQAVENIDYTLSGTTISFDSPKVAGTDIDVTVIKSVDATGLGSVQDEIEELQEQMADIKNIGEYLYVCNGYDDNVKLTEIAQAFFASSAEETVQLTVNVYGTFGANAPFSGTGASTSRYRWMILGSESTAPNKKLVFDFLNCSAMKFNGEAGKHYICIHGNGVDVRNATIIARQRNTEGSVVVFSATAGAVYASNCRFDVSAYAGSYIAQTGTFVDCWGSVTDSRDNAYCFDASTGGLLRVQGGEYYAYTGLSGSNAAVINVSSAAAHAAVFAEGVNCPTAAKASHYQKNAVLAAGGRGYAVATITALAMSAGANWSLVGTIALSKPNVG